MKNIFKAFGVIAIVVIIGFSFAACRDGGGGDDDDNNNDDKNNNNSGTAPTITIASLPNGTVGTAYSQALTATGGTPITWNIDTGTLPAGLSITGTGTISGTPTTAGTSNFTVKAANTTGSTTKQLSITIASGSSSERWRGSKRKNYSVTNGVASLSSESVNNWITDHYTSDTNYEIKYTTNTTEYGTTTITTSQTIHQTRNGQTYVLIITNATDTTTITYDSASGLESKYTVTSNLGGTTTTQEYTIQLLSDSGGVKTYKHYINKLIQNNVSQDISDRGYSEYKIQNGKKLEQKKYTKDGVLDYTSTYTYSDNAVIRAKIGDHMLIRYDYPSYNSYVTVEVVSDSATELVIRDKIFTNNVLSSYSDITFEKVK